MRERLVESQDPFAIIDFWSGVNPEPIFIFDDEKEKLKNSSESLNNTSSPDIITRKEEISLLDQFLSVGNSS